MAFVKKTWEDRDAEFLNRRSLTDPTTGTTEIRDIGLAEGDVYVEGDKINAENFNDLEQRIEDAINEIPVTEVEVTPVVTDGETLATIRVNEDTSDIKMPKPFEVKITYASGEYSADKTLNEIYAAAENGYEVYALYGMEMFCLAGYSRSSADFISIYHTASSKTLTIRSFNLRLNGTITLDSKILYNLPSISGSSSVGRLMTVSSAGGENRYSLTTDNTIDDAHTNAKRTYSSQKVDAELQARDAEIALKADSADVDTALALKADKADTYTKSQVDTALSAKANISDVTASLALKADKADTYTKTEVDTALGLKADKATTYTKSEVDTALALKADETDLPTKTSDLTNDSDYQTGEQVSQAVSEAVENKADIDGTYEDMTVGTAMKLVATRHTTDTAPYLFRQSGGDNNAYVGTEETDKLVGASAVVNQMVDTGATEVPTISGRKYYTRINSVVTIQQGTGTAISINDASKDNVSDLTQMFGTTIADYVYSLESATAGSGIAYLRKYGFFTKDYYPYTANTLQSVNTSKHITVTGNLFDIANSTIIGSRIVNYSTGEIGSWGSSWTAISSFIPVAPQTQYYIHSKTGFSAGGNAGIAFYDYNHQYISGLPYTSAFKVKRLAFVTPSNAFYMRWCGTTPTVNDCVLTTNPNATEYEPYVKHEYTLPNIDLRGLYKLDASNNLYADGDTLEGDGTLTRKYGVIDLGTLTWSALSGRFRAPQSQLGTKIGTQYQYIAYNLINSKYPVMGYDYTDQYDKVCDVDSVGNFRVKDSAYTDAQTFKAAMSGVYLIYELATPTTEQATGFTNPQLVDKYGTEEYTDERDFPLPVGHETDYPLESEMPLPIPPVTAGTYNLQLTVDASGNQTYSWAT